MAQTGPPKDSLGNELHVGDLVTLVTNRPVPYRVLKVENGGIQTPQGVTPGMIAIGTTVTLGTIPGGQIVEVARLVSPGSDELVRKIIDAEN